MRWHDERIDNKLNALFGAAGIRRETVAPIMQEMRDDYEQALLNQRAETIALLLRQRAETVDLAQQVMELQSQLAAALATIERACVAPEANAGALYDLMAMLTGGELPEGVTMPDQPKLEQTQAFSVVWYLQEILQILPDNFEMCAVCNTVFDYNNGGTYVDDDLYEETSWYADCGFSRETVAECAGMHFCDSECEAGYMRDVQFGRAP